MQAVHVENSARLTRKEQHPRMTGLLKLALAIALLLTFMFGIAPAVQQRVEPLKQLGQYIEDSGIAANMIYYTEVPATGDAERAMRDSMNFPPTGGKSD